MIEITRLLARQLSTVFKRALRSTSKSDGGPWVYFIAGLDGLRARVILPEAAADYHVVGHFQPAKFAVPLSLLTDCAGRQDDLVQFQVDSAGTLLASWTDGGIPQQHEVRQSNEAPLPEFPMLPESMGTNGLGLLAALREAADTTDNESFRYALHCVQLCGQSGQVVATDGRQLLVQGGFEFPWNGDLLVRRTKLFCCSQLHDQVAKIGATDDWLTLAVGPWTIHLALEKNARFPKTGDILRMPADAVARLQLTTGDAQRIVRTVGRLPGGKQLNAPVTLDLNGEAIIRARGDNQPRVTELVLTRAQLSGDSLRINVNRTFLARALTLGFHELLFFGPEAPIQCQDGQRRYVWMPLTAHDAIGPSDDPLRIESPASDKAPITARAPYSRRRFAVASANESDRVATSGPQASARNGHMPSALAAGKSREAHSAVDQAIAVKRTLRSMAAQTNELIRLIKRQKREARLARTPAQSRKQLRPAG